MIVLDTTVLIYAVGTERRFRDPCRERREAIRTGRVAATTTVEVIQEFAHVRARRRGRSDPAELTGAFCSQEHPRHVIPDEAGIRRLSNGEPGPS